MEELVQYLRHRGMLSQGFLLCLGESLHYTRYAKGDMLLKAGQVAERIWFLKTGIVRWEYEHVVTWFSSAHTMIYPAQSFNAQTPFRESLIAAQNCETWSVTRKVVYEFYQMFPETTALERTIKDELQEQIREHSFLKSNPSMSERFRFLQRKFPELLYRVPDAHLASFLNMSERSFRKLKNARK
ncbi:MAG: Crp/Fnr family transcriptional regulator [Chitinophagaceae bacterium]